MKKENEALDILVDWIISSCKKLIEKAHFDQTYTGVISKVDNENKSYTVKYAGSETTVKTSAISIYKVGDLVKICVPLGNRRKAFIVADLDLIFNLTNKQ